MNRMITIMLVVGACGDDGTSSDSGAIDGGSGDAGSPSPVTLSQSTHWIDENGVDTTVPSDATGQIFTVVVPSEGFVEHTGVGAGTTVIIPDVPTGVPYYLRYPQEPGDYPYFLIRTEHMVEQHFGYLGRQDTVRGTEGASTTLVIDATGLVPWQDSDFVGLVSMRAASGVQYFGSITPAGDTSLMGLSVDYAGLPLIEGSKGDRLLVLQGVATPLAGSVVANVTRRIFEAPAFDMRDGESTSLSGSFVDVPADRTLDVTVPREALTILADFVYPGASLEGNFELGVLPAAQTWASSWYGPMAPLARLGFDAGTTNIATSIPYGNPYPAVWEPFVMLDVLYYVEIGGLQTLAGITAFLPIDEASGTLAIPVEPPRNVSMTTGATPTISWDDTPNAASYQVNVVEIGTGGTRTQVAGFDVVGETSIVCPPGIVEAGRTYFVRVIATSDHGLPGGSAHALGGPFSP